MLCTNIVFIIENKNIIIFIKEIVNIYSSKTLLLVILFNDLFD